MIKVLFSLGIYRTSLGDGTPRTRCDRWFAAAGKPKAVLVVTHGMNLSPLKMDELAETFAQRGYEVFRPGFCGHHGNTEEILGVKAEEWEADAYRIHEEAHAKAAALGVPLHLIAYSFSGLIFQVLSQKLPFHKRVYLAPALALHFWYLPLMWLVRLIPWLTFQTVIPEDYGANERSGVRSVMAMDAFFLRWQLGEGGEPNGPTLIWAAKRDELVHARKLQKMAAANPNWEFRETNVSGSHLTRKYHHLIVDSKALGSEEFARVVDGTEKFLASP